MKFIKLIIIFSFTVKCFAQSPVGTGFNYQGELSDNGAMANGIYDMEFVLFDSESSQTPLLIPKVVVTAVDVTNGLFNISNIDFNFVPFYQGNEVWMEVAVKKSSTTDDFERLTTRQRIGAVPYSYKSETSDFATIAGDLLANGASVNDVLMYDGINWGAKKLGWRDQNNILSLANESYQVLLGNPVDSSSAKLTVKTDEDGLVTKFIGSGEMHNDYFEADVPIGYVGSVQDGTNAGTTTEDFEIGTKQSNVTGNMHLTIQEAPILTIANNGNIGINNTTPTGKLDINIDANDNAKPIKITKGSEIFGIHTNAGASIGDSTVPPNSGIYSKGDIKQEYQSNGLVKYLVNASCGINSPSIINSYNGVNSDVITITAGNSGDCFIHFPSDIEDRYYQVTVASRPGVYGLMVSCDQLNPASRRRTLGCYIRQATANGFQRMFSDIMVTIY